MALSLEFLAWLAAAKAALALVLAPSSKQKKTNTSKHITDFFKLLFNT
jgi:hypothetical protein